MVWICAKQLEEDSKRQRKYHGVVIGQGRIAQYLADRHKGIWQDDTGIECQHVWQPRSQEDERHDEDEDAADLKTRRFFS